MSTMTITSPDGIKIRMVDGVAECARCEHGIRVLRGVEAYGDVPHVGLVHVQCPSGR